MRLPDDVITQIFSWASADMISIYSDIPAEEILNDFFTGFNKAKNNNVEEQGEVKGE